MKPVQDIRWIPAFALLAAVVLGASPIHAGAQYTFTGKFARSNGAFIDIPLVGNNPGGVANCGRTLNFMAGMTMTTTMRTQIHQGYLFFPSTAAGPDGQSMTGQPTSPINYTMFANRFGCISGAGTVTATAAGTGAAFTVPPMAFSRGYPVTATNMTMNEPIALSVPLLPNIVQLATSFMVTLPPTAISTSMGPNMGADVPNGTMNNGTNTAPFRRFHRSAWKGGPASTFNSQTGRAGPNFTWCFGMANCLQGNAWKTTANGMTFAQNSRPTTNAYRTPMSFPNGIPAGNVDNNGNPNAGAPHQVFVRYTAGPNRFGGTMSHIITTGGNPSSLAISAGGVLQMLNLAGMGSQPTGRGYADFLTDPLMGGSNFLSFSVGPVSVEEIMSFHDLVTFRGPMLVGGPGLSQTITLNKNFGFPFTTGTVLARNTGTDVQGNPVVVTLTGMGGDEFGVITIDTPSGTDMVFGREISLVAGAAAGIDTLSSETPALAQIIMRMPEPSAPAQLIAGVVVLLGVGAWRSRRGR